MKRSHYSVTLLVVAVLSLVGLMRKALEPLVPPLPPNGLFGQPGRFLRQADRQAVDWLTLDSSPFSLARSESKPILLVVGAPWSWVGRQVDRDSFESSNVLRLLADRFVCVRVDTFQDPEWGAALLPLNRLTHGYTDGYSVYVLSPNGTIITTIAQDSGSVAIDATVFQAALESAIAKYEQSISSGVSLPDPQAEELRQLAMLPGNAVPNFSGFATTLEGFLQPGSIGFPIDGQVEPCLQSVHYLLLTGKTNDAKKVLDGMIRSPLVNAVQSGVYAFATLTPNRLVTFDQLATENADFAWNLALSAALSGDPLANMLAPRSFDFTLRAFKEDGLLDGVRVGDESAANRSAHASFSPADLRRLLNLPERNEAIQDLGLRFESNRQMVPYFSCSSQVAESASINALLHKLHSAQGRKPILGAKGLLAVNGYCVARLLETARLWGDASHLDQITGMVDRLDQFRSGDDVQHSITQTPVPETYLGDYLAYSDCMLNDYLADGRVVSLSNGLAVLQRAMSLFSTSIAGAFSDGETSPTGILALNLPSVADSTTESTSAELMRLAYDYGRLLGDTSTGISLQRKAEGIMGLFSQIPPSTPLLGGYFCSSAKVFDQEFAVAVGPNAQHLADALFRLRPTRLVAAATGPVWQSLQSKQSGLYVIRSRYVVGPLSLSQAAKLLPLSLQIGAASN